MKRVGRVVAVLLALGATSASAEARTSTLLQPGLVAATELTAQVGLELATNPPPEKRRYVVAAIGDSLTDTRVGGAHYIATLARACPDSRFDAYGVGGQQTSHMRWRFRADVFGEGKFGTNKPEYTHVLVLGGVNDLASAGLRATSTRRIERNLSTMYAMAKKRGLGVIAVTVAPWTGLAGGVDDTRIATTRKLNRWILAQPDSGSVDQTVDIFPSLACGESLCDEYRRFTDDLVHWNSAGHVVVGKQLLKEAFSDCR